MQIEISVSLEIFLTITLKEHVNYLIPSLKNMKNKKTKSRKIKYFIIDVCLDGMK